MSRPPSDRYRTFVAGEAELVGPGIRLPFDKPLQLAETVRGAAGEAEAVVWVHERAAAAWGLPERLARDHVERVDALLGVPCRPVGSSGWVVVQGQPKVYVAFPGYSGDFAGAADPVQLLDALESFRLAVGYGFLFSGASTLHKLITSTSTISASVPEPELEPGYTASAWSVPANSWGLVDLSIVAGVRQWVRCFDRSGSFLSAWRGLQLPIGDWLHHGPGEVDAGREADKPTGYYLVDPEALPDLEGGLSPWRRHGDGDGPLWLTAPLLQLATELLDGPLEVLDAWVTLQHARVLDVAGERIGDARAALADAATPPADLALQALKVAYAGATAWFEYGPRAPEPLARPAWRRTIIDRYAANTFRSLAKATPSPFAFTEIDTAIFAVARPGDVPEGLRTGTGLGAWKPKGEPIPMARAVDAVAAGGPRALVAIAEGRA